MTLGVLIVDDQTLMRAGFRMILESEEGLEVVAEAAAGLDGWRSGGLEQLRATFVPYDSVGDVYATHARILKKAGYDGHILKVCGYTIGASLNSSMQPRSVA